MIGGAIRESVRMGQVEPAFGELVARIDPGDPV